MLILLSPAKTLNFEKQNLVRDFTIPSFLGESEELVSILKKYSVNQLAKLMKLNPKLAQLNFERFQEWQQPFSPKNAKQAILSFKGDVYTGLNADSFDIADFQYAQDNLLILSGLYGVLKSLDLIQPYRLEMSTKLKIGKKQSLYDFWGNKITEYLKQQNYDGVLINLASNEYFKSINKDLLATRVITPVFKENRNGTYMFVHVYGKKARGLMTRFIIKNKINDPEQIKLFDIEGYYYNDRLSSENEWLFTR